jgi:hypothetical protein
MPSHANVLCVCVCVCVCVCLFWFNPNYGNETYLGTNTKFEIICLCEGRGSNLWHCTPFWRIKANYDQAIPCDGRPVTEPNRQHTKWTGIYVQWNKAKANDFTAHFKIKNFQLSDGRFQHCEVRKGISISISEVSRDSTMLRSGP